jgi:hypothetical protein
MTSFEINPYDLHLAIAANNPQGVAANLASKGVPGLSENSDAPTLVAAAYKLEKEGFFEQFVADLSHIFNVQFDPNGEQSDFLASVMTNSVAPMVLANALTHEPNAHILISQEQHEQEKKESFFWFILACVFGGVLLLKIIFK